MYARNFITAGLVTFYLSSAACASAPIKDNIIMEPRAARINLQKRIDEFMANRDFVNVFMITDNADKDIHLYNGPADMLRSLEYMLLSFGVFRKTSVNGSPFASVVLNEDYQGIKIEIDYLGTDGEQLKLQLGYAELSGLADSLR